MIDNNAPFNELLYNFWERTSNPQMKNDTSEWYKQVQYLSQHGIGTEEALKYLYSQRPSFEDFTNWITKRTRSLTITDDHDKVLSGEDLVSWRENGYIIIRDAVTQEQCDAARKAIWDFLDANPENPGTWYTPHPAKNGLMLSFFDHPALDANRTSAKIKKVYRELYEEEDIYLLVDKVSFNPPEKKGYSFAGSPLHWDVSLQTPIPFELQGLLYLNDVSAEEGAFHCVPGFHNKIETWLKDLPVGSNPRELAIQELQPLPIPGNAGDLVIWHQALPHCATPNKGQTPRLVQYIAYKPVNPVSQSQWI